MVKAETSALGEYSAAHPGRDAELRAGGRRAGTAGRRPAGAVGDGAIRTGERGAL
jgi:hypothetical protein